MSIQESLALHYGRSCSRLTPLAGGLIHSVWRADTDAGPLVVKRYHGPDWAPERILPTLQNQMRLASAGHPVPRVYPTRSGALLAPDGDGWLTLQAFAPGGHLKQEELTPAIAHAIGATLGRLHGSLATLPVGDGAPFIPQTEGVREGATALLEAATAQRHPDDMDRLAIAAARFRLDRLDRGGIDPGLYVGKRYQVVHGDYYPNNLLFSPDGAISAVIDWDFSGPRWREMEVARAAVEVGVRAEGDLDQGRVIAFLTGYLAEQPLSSGERRGMFQLWFDYLLWSLYPLPLKYRPDGALPTGWEALAHRRHRMLLLLDRYLPDLEGWVERSIERG